MNLEKEVLEETNANIDYLEKKALALKYIIDTHTHADHFSLAAVLKKIFACFTFMLKKKSMKIGKKKGILSQK